MRKKGFAALAAFFVLMICMTVMTGCGTDDIDISQYSNSKIILSGLTEKDEVITAGQLKAMDCVTKKTESTSDKIGQVRATGPWLSTVLETYGCSQEDFSKIKIYGKDDYDISLYRDFLQENKILLAFGIDGQPLNGEDRPVRIIIPGSDSAYWVRMVSKIEFVK